MTNNDITQQILQAGENLKKQFTEGKKIINESVISQDKKNELFKIMNESENAIASQDMGKILSIMENFKI